VKTPKEQLLEAIDPVAFWQSEFPQWSSEEDLVPCPIHKDEAPSLSLSASGKFNCFGCNFSGTSVIGYYTDVYCQGNFRVALKRLFSKYVTKVVEEKTIEDAHDKLMGSAKARHALLARRGWSESTLEKFKIGWDAKRRRTTIPIYNLGNMAVDIRRHDSLRLAPKKDGKRIPMLASAPGGNFFPLGLDANPFLKDEVFILEGEPDVILAHDQGLNAVTVTGGAGKIANMGYVMACAFTGKHVVICLDNDQAGKDAAKKLAREFAKVDLASLKIVHVPEGNDFTEYVLNHGGDKNLFLQHVRQAPYLFKPKNSNVTECHLSDTGDPKLTGTNIRTRVLVSGKHQSPFSIPKRLEYRCEPNDDGYCAVCQCRDDGRAEWVIQSDDTDILDWLTKPKEKYPELIKQGLGSTCRRRMQVSVLEYQSVEQLVVVPGLSAYDAEQDNKYVTRNAYCVDCDVDANKHYEFDAIPTPYPRTRESVLLVHKAKGSHDAIETFRLTEERISKLRGVFTDSPRQTVTEIAKTLSVNYTNIIGRPDLHVAADLCYHSAFSFDFNGQLIPKGSLELLFFGDTRAGKGSVAEGLSRAFGLGAVVSGENASFMGLVGGLSKLREAFILQWGALPLNNGRLVIIDEFSGLDEVLGKLSRIRSEGLAEINKGGIHSKTQANARVIWIANPRGGKALSQFSTGVEAIEDLVKMHEDIARFDLVCVASKDAVSVADINKPRESKLDNKYTTDVLRDVILWAWSRKREDITFSKAATTYILNASIKLAEEYSSAIPLIQGENVRFKIAKVAVAIAARCFSTPDGKRLNVEKDHAVLAVQLIRWLYNNPACGYDRYSESHNVKAKLVKLDALSSIFTQLNKEWESLVDCLLEAEFLQHRDLQDWLDVPIDVANEFIGSMVRSNALKKRGKYYVKRPAFIKWLRALKKRGIDSLRKDGD
jgi:hypothetical protein